jgi:membrane associated rhomboid family serine protease
MANFLVDDVKSVFRGSGNSLSKIIVINVIVFILFNLTDAFFTIGTGKRFVFETFAFNWLGIPGNALTFLTRFWTIVTYMFLHTGFFHILFNMLWLYWMGKILDEYIGYKKFNTVFFLGGICGGFFYVFVFSVLNFVGISPGMGHAMVGASAGVMAVVFATATLLPNNEISLLFIGPVRLKYIALGALILTTLLDFSHNTGGKIAHLGGAYFGFFFIRQLQRGVDISQSFYALIDSVFGVFKSKPKMKVVRKERVVTNYDKTYQHNVSHPLSKMEKQKKTDIILDKISKSGYDSLSKEEKDFLFKVSKDD